MINWNSDRTSSLAKSWQPNKQQRKYSSFSGRVINRDESLDMKSALTDTGPVKYDSYSILENSVMDTEFNEFTVYQTPDERRS